MRIVILDGSPRRGGNTDILVDSFVRGASDGNDIIVFRVSDMDIAPCTGCESCFRSPDHGCCRRDDMFRIYDAMSGSDVLVLASPVYFYGISSQLKKVIDRLHTPMRNDFAIRSAAIMLVGAAGLPNLFDPILMQYRMALEFFGLEDLGSVLVRGVRGKGDIAESPALDEAYELGRAVGRHPSDSRLSADHRHYRRRHGDPPRSGGPLQKGHQIRHIQHPGR